MWAARATALPALAALLWLVLVGHTPSAHAVCVGDCDRGGDVSSDEVHTCIANLFASPLSAERCGACDRDSDGRVTVAEVQAAQAASIDGGNACAMVIPGPAPLITLSAASGQAGERVAIEVALQRNNAPVASTSTDITFDSGLVDVVFRNGAPDCTLNPAIGDKQRVVSLLPSPPEAQVLRIGVLSFSNPSVIPDGLLFTCVFEIAPDATGDIVLAASADAADPQANPIAADTTGGRITVQDLPLATATPTAERPEASATETVSPNPSPTATESPTATPSGTRTRTPTRRQTPTPTITPTTFPSGTPSATPPPSSTPTRTPSPEKATQTPRRTRTPTVTRAETNTRTPSPSVPPTASRTPSRTRSPSVSPTPRPTSRTPSRTPSATLTATVALPTATPTPTRPTATPTPTRPTATPTPTRPTATPSATRTPRPPTRTPTATRNPANRPRIDIGGATGGLGDIVEVDTTLRAQGAAVAGTSNEITFDATQLDVVQQGGKPDCTINPSIGADSDFEKSLFASLPTAPVTARVLQVFVFSFSSTASIPDGVLYTCRFQIAETARDGIHLLTNIPMAAGPTGAKVDVVGSDGRVTVQ